MGFILMLIVGGLIGWIAGGILGRDIPGGILGNIIAGIVGAWLGSLIFGDWGWHLGGIAIFPALIGTIILVALVSFILGKLRKK
ncbi:GlsB/YeaQ/YmgE family stress response membrane protein [Staphylococcus caeli]|uniref:Transglycosylase associated family protein n=1 Tax=Staphylococcus caeli TaxID=2201815 RepID=A0A1D4GSZ3_9STAP|nr:GlsB/YeaQ/YmgE family stress response membrane protein [Staphylococcus caeli]SCS28024.1 transglycosylase associated family protein [Staphylococcus caeli]SCS38648.1 transglycosylase associated family protein [Staphylococcus caeli]